MYMIVDIKQLIKPIYKSEFKKMNKPNFFQKLLAMSVSWFGLMSNRIDAKTLQLQERAKDEINIPVLRKEFEIKSNKTLQNIKEQYKNVLVDVNLKTKAVESNTIKLDGIADAILRLEETAVVLTGDDFNDRQLIKAHDWKIKNLRLEARSLMSEINYDKQHIKNQESIVEQLYDQYNTNRYRAREAINQMKSLEYRNTLAESRQVIEQITLGESELKILDIVQIVEGKEANVAATALTNQVLIGSGDRTLYDDVQEQATNTALDNELNQFLLTRKNKNEGIQNSNVETGNVEYIDRDVY